MGSEMSPKKQAACESFAFFCLEIAWNPGRLMKGRFGQKDAKFAKVVGEWRTVLALLDGI